MIPSIRRPRLICYIKKRIFKKSTLLNTGKAKSKKRPIVQNNETNETDQIPARKINISDLGSSSAGTSSISGSVISISKNVLHNRYSSHNQGPFDIHIQRTSDPKSPLHPITVGRILCSFKNDDILEIKRAGYSKVSVFLKTREAINNLVEDHRLPSHNLIAFISPFCTSRKGIIRKLSTYGKPSTYGKIYFRERQ